MASTTSEEKPRKRPILPSFGKGTEEKCNDSLRELQSRFSKGKNSSKSLNLKKSVEKTLKVLILASSEGDDEKAQYASFKHIVI